MMCDSKSTKISNLFMNTGSVVSRGLMLGTSLIVLSACLPEQSRVQSEAMMNNQTSQAQSYAQAIQQYSSRSFNSFVSSPAWRQQTVEEDMLDPLNGSSSNYISSAYCKDETGQDYHLTWFNTDDADGNLSLKGLGSGSSGIVNARLHQMVNGAALAVARSGNQLEFTDNSTTLSSTCTSNIDIPLNSAVVAYRLERPEPISVVGTKSLYKTEACPDGENGTIVSTIEAQITADDEILVAGQSFASEQAAMEASGLPWVENANCHVRQANFNYQVDDTVRASALSLSSSITNSDITTALEENLNDIECRKLNESQIDGGNVEPDGDQQELYHTCAQGHEAKILQRTTITEIGTLPPETLTYGCMARPGAGVSTINLNSSHTGIPSQYHGMNAQLNAAGYLPSGEIQVTKTTTQHRAIIDHDGTIQERIIESVELEGTSIQCRAANAIRIPCSSIFAGYHSATGKGPRYRTVVTVDAWDDPQALIQAKERLTPYAYEANSMNCTVTDSRINNLRCPSGQTGTRSNVEQRVATVTSPSQNLSASWGGWSVVSTTNTCKTPSFRSSGGGGGGNSKNGFDVDGDGKADFSSRTSAASAGFRSGRDVEDRSNNSGARSGTTSGGTSYSGSRDRSDSGGSGGDGCFVAGTMVKMNDGSEKPVEQITLGDEVYMGGRVTATGAFLVTDIYDYKGVLVSGSHAVYEDGQWVRVRDAKYAILSSDHIETAVYVHANEHHRIVINDIVFADYQEVPREASPHWQDMDDDHLKLLNNLT